MINKRIFLTVFLCFISRLSLANENDQDKAVYTLWSDQKDCYIEGASLIAIEAYQNSFKVTACAPLGCRISVNEFGKKAHAGDYRSDPKFDWLSETEFETKINGSKKHFYHCFTKQ